MSDLHAAFEGTESRVREMIEQATLASYGEYEKAYIAITDGQLAIISSLAKTTTSSYGTFDDNFLDVIEVGDGANGDKAEALFDIETFLDYLEVVGGEGKVRVEFREGSTVSLDDGEHLLATVAEMKGALNNQIRISASATSLDAMPLWLPGAFDEGDTFGIEGNPPLDTEIHTTAGEVERILEAVDMEDVDTNDGEYPIVVEDETFKLEVGSDTGNSVWGELKADEVSGSDVGNTYGEPFAPVFETLDGRIRLNTTTTDEGPAPLAVVQSFEEGATVRHVVGPNGVV